jgi:hypothetical protein
VGARRRTAGDLQVDERPGHALQLVSRDELSVDGFECGDVEVDAHPSQPSLEPGQVAIETEWNALVEGRDLVDTIAEEEATVVNRDRSLGLREERPVQIDGAQ